MGNLASHTRDFPTGMVFHEVLCTRELKDALVIKAQEQHIRIYCESYFEIVPFHDEPLAREVRNWWTAPGHCAVFTSQYAVKAVATILGPDESRPTSMGLYTLQGASLEAIQEAGWGSLVRGTAARAQDLADLMLNDPVTGPVIFFAGDQRRPDLPEAFARAGRVLHECVVYGNRPKPRLSAITHPEALLFFSPSAVEGYLTTNQPTRDTPCFAIGPTTAETLIQHGFQKIHQSPEPRSESLIDQLIDYFTHKTQKQHGTEK